MEPVNIWHTAASKKVRKPVRVRCINTLDIELDIETLDTKDSSPPVIHLVIHPVIHLVVHYANPV